MPRWVTRMADGDLAGIGVLVTRPEHQAADLIDTVEASGGTAIFFPALEIVPRDAAAIADDVTAMREPDIVIFVSSNAVRFGLEHTGSARIAAVGPATAAAVEAAGRSVDIRAAGGYDSEHLLAETEMYDVGGNVVRIIRGSAGRELIADTLRDRGATVEYLSVYERRAPDVDAASLAELDAAWRDEKIDVVTVMSVETLRNLVAMLPETSRDLLSQTLLVTPAARVIKEAHNLFPDIPTAQADGTAAEDMVRAIAEHVPGQS